MKTSSFLFNGYIYPKETTSTSDTTYISVRIPDLSEEMIRNKTPFKALLQCVCSTDNYYLSSDSETSFNKVSFELNGVARDSDSEVRVYPYNKLYEEAYGEAIPSVTYSNGGLYLVEYMNKRFTILPISNLADIARNSENEYVFPFDIHIDGVNRSLKQIAELVDTLSDLGSAVTVDEDGNVIGIADIQANGGEISLKELSQAVALLRSAQEEQLESIKNLQELTETLKDAVSKLQLDLDNVVTYTNGRDIIFTDSEAVEVSLRNFYESASSAIESYAETITSHTEAIESLSGAVSTIGQTVSSMESTVEGYGESINELTSNFKTLSTQLAELIESLDLSKYLTLDEDGSVTIPNDVFFNGSTLPEDYQEDVQSLIQVITLIDSNMSTIQETVAEIEDTVSSLATASVCTTVYGKNPVVTDSTDASLLYAKFNGYTVQDGTPTPDAPIDIQGLGDSGVIEVKTKNEDETEETTASIPITSPLYDGDYMEVYADGSGKIVRWNYETTLDGSKTYTGDSTLTNCIRFGIKHNQKALSFTENVGHCSNLPLNRSVNTYYTDNEHFYVSDTNIVLFLNKSRLTSLDTSGINEYLTNNNFKVVFKLAEPTEEPLTAEQVEEFKKLSTFKNITNFFCDGEIAARYYCNTDGGDTVSRLQNTVDDIPNIYAKKALYDDTAINVGRKSDTTVGYRSTAEGYETTASGEASHAEGQNTTVLGIAAHAEGDSTTASGDNSHAEGVSTTASGRASHAEGDSTTASGYSSHAEGYDTTAGYNFQHVQGKYNDNKSEDLFEVGNGTSDNNRSNALELTTEGRLKTRGDIVNGNDVSLDEINRNLDTLDTMPLLKASDLEIGHWYGSATDNKHIRTKNKLPQGEYIFFNNGNYSNLVLMDYATSSTNLLDEVHIGESKKITTTSDTRMYIGDGSTTYTSDDFEKAVKSINYYKVGVITETVDKQNDTLDDFGMTNKFNGWIQGGYSDEGEFSNLTDRITTEVTLNNSKSLRSVIDLENTGYYISVFNGSSYIGRATENWSDTRDITTKIPSNATKAYVTIITSISATNASDISIYIDSEFDRINASLEQLEYSDIAGGANLFCPQNKINGNYNKDVGEILDTSLGNGVLSQDSNGLYTLTTNSSWGSAGYYFNSEQGKKYTLRFNVSSTFRGTIYFTDSSFKVLSVFKVIQGGVESSNTVTKIAPSGTKYVVIGVTNIEASTITFNLQIEEGETATDYKQYIPSVKMLADDVTNVKNDLDKSKSKLDNISIDTIDRALGEITFKGIDFAAELTLLKIGNQLELLRGKIYTVGSYFSVTSGDVLSFDLSVSEFGDYINGLKTTAKLAFSGQGIFNSKVIGMIEIGNYTSSSGDKGGTVMLRFNDSYNFSANNVKSGAVIFNF